MQELLGRRSGRFCKICRCVGPRWRLGRRCLLVLTFPIFFLCFASAPFGFGLGLAIEFLFAARLCHLSLLLLCFLLGLLAGLNFRFLLFAGLVGLDQAGLFPSALLGFGLSFPFGLGVAAFRFDTRALGLGSLFGFHFCLALRFLAGLLRFLFGLALLFFGAALGFDLFFAFEFSGFALGLLFDLGRSRGRRDRDGSRRLSRLRRRRGGGFDLAVAGTAPVSNGHWRFAFTAQLAGRNRVEFSSADFFHHLGLRAFVDDRIIDHLDVG